LNLFVSFVVSFVVSYARFLYVYWSVMCIRLVVITQIIELRA